MELRDRWIESISTHHVSSFFGWVRQSGTAASHEYHRILRCSWWTLHERTYSTERLFGVPTDSTEKEISDRARLEELYLREYGIHLFVFLHVFSSPNSVDTLRGSHGKGQAAAEIAGARGRQRPIHCYLQYIHAS